MQKRTIGPIFVEWSEHLLMVRRTWLSVRWEILSALCLPFAPMLLVDHWLHKRSWVQVIVDLWLFLLCALIANHGVRRLRARLIFDRVTDSVRDRKTELVALSDVLEAEAGRAEWLKHEFFSIQLRLRGGRGMKGWEPDLIDCKHKAQAQKLAEIVNDFLRQPEAAETPSVWPPPPRRAERAADPPVWKRAKEKDSKTDA